MGRGWDPGQEIPLSPEGEGRVEGESPRPRHRRQAKGHGKREGKQMVRLARFELTTSASAGQRSIR